MADHRRPGHFDKALYGLQQGFIHAFWVAQWSGRKQTPGSNGLIQVHIQVKERYAAGRPF
jgi:hypothetical protein